MGISEEHMTELKGGSVFDESKEIYLEKDGRTLYGLATTQ